MDKIIYKELIKVILCLISPILIISLLLFDLPLKMVVAFIIGVLLGVLRLKALFKYIISALDQEKGSHNKINLAKYLSSVVCTLGLICFVLVKDTHIGLAMLAGMLSVSLIIAAYAFAKGIWIKLKN